MTSGCVCRRRGMIKKRTAILCAGYHSRVVAEILGLRDECEVIGILDDNAELHNTVRNGLPIIGGLSVLRELKDAGRANSAALGLGNLALLRRRMEIYEDARSLGIEMIRVVHPTSFVSPTAVCGAGIFLGPNAVIHTATKVGENVMVSTGSTIDHDNEIGDHVFISAGVHTAGLVKIEQGVFIGPGAIVGNGCVIGKECVVGAGSVINSDIPAGKVALGSPARVLMSVEEWQKQFLNRK
jgi:sugar O-acyltransferase (sialic acid O-acetyltransferase NeuD family)